MSAQIAELEFTYGEGPSIDACHGDHPVLEPNLADPSSSRWVGFTRPAVEAGAQAVFSFPLRAGKKSFGALNLYRDRPGPLRGEQHADVLAMADVAAEAILRMWTPDSSSSATATRSSDFSSAQPVVHQAAGMLSAQLNVSVAEALVRLRGYACSQDRRLAEVASDVVRRVLRLEHD